MQKKMRMIIYILENSTSIKNGKDQEFKNGLMELFLKDVLQMIKLMVLVILEIMIIIIIEDILLIILSVDSEFIHIKVEQAIQDGGKMIHPMVQEQKIGKIIHYIQVNLKKEKSTEQVNIFGRMELNILENGIKIVLKDMEYIIQMIKEFIKENGQTV